MFNLSGSEIVFILLLALVILGPEKLPEALRSFGRTYGELKKMSSGFQSEFKQALDEPVRELRGTADALRQAANFDAAADLLEGRTPRTAPGADAPGAAGPAPDPTSPNGSASAAARSAAGDPFAAQAASAETPVRPAAEDGLAAPPDPAPTDSTDSAPTDPPSTPTIDATAPAGAVVSVESTPTAVTDDDREPGTRPR